MRARYHTFSAAVSGVLQFLYALLPLPDQGHCGDGDCAVLHAPDVLITSPRLPVDLPWLHALKGFLPSSPLRSRQPLNGANSAHQVDNQSPVHQSPLKLVAQTLIGDLEHKKLRSDEPVIVTQGQGDNQNEFKSASMQADLMTGDYDFRQVAVTFVPPKRQDTPLF